MGSGHEDAPCILLWQMWTNKIQCAILKEQLRPDFSERGNVMDIRAIERIIDKAHEGNIVFKTGKKQTIYDLLSTFEELCGLILRISILNPLSSHKIIDQMDALNTALLWADQLCPEDPGAQLMSDISEIRYEQCRVLLTEYAYVYSAICSGYIAYSRKRFDAVVDDHCVTFNVSDGQNQSVWSDILREGSENQPNMMAELISLYELLMANEELKDQISIEDGALCYSLPEDILISFRKIAEKQWEATKTLPVDWKFDLFTLEEYRAFWIAIATLCYIHFCACLTIQDPALRLKNSTILQSRDSLVEYITAVTGLSADKAGTIIKYITFDFKKKNNDIMYQPIVEIEKDRLILAPILFMGSRPERNLIAVVSTMHDSEYSKEVNCLENLMVTELASCITSPNIIKHRHIRKDLPDIDFAVLDQATASAMIFETKWFTAADSTKEVYAKEDEITHGCEQVDSLMAYAMSNREHFFKQVFGVDNGDTIDLFGCVVARHNIRTQHKYVPVIDLKCVKELLSSYPLNTAFHLIRNHAYEMELPSDAIITHQDFDYAGFKFKIPAICYGA